MRTVHLGRAKSEEEWGGQLSPGCSGDGIRRKSWGSWVKARKLAFFGFPGTSRPCATAGRLGTRQAIREHTGADRQCTNASKAGINADA